MVSQENMRKLLEWIHTDSVCGIRDRAIYELIYSSGLRAGEAARLKVGDVDFENRILYIRKSKHGKDRFVPVTEGAAAFLAYYLEERIAKKESYVFPGTKNRHIAVTTISRRFKGWAKKAGVYEKGLCIHSVRHATATHLLENGAGIRYVQELLGHESIETTVSYTKQLYRSLKQMYKRYHPRENEYYKEVDEEYCKRIDELESRLKARNEKTLRDRKYSKKV